MFWLVAFIRVILTCDGLTTKLFLILKGLLVFLPLDFILFLCTWEVGKVARNHNIVRQRRRHFCLWEIMKNIS